MTRAPASRALAGALLSCFLPAQGPDPLWLPSDTTFVAYLDLRALTRLVGEERLRAALRDDGVDLASGFLTTAWEVWTGEAASREPKQREPRQQDEIARIERDWGVNLLRDFHGFTLFGSDTRDGEGALLVVASARVDATLARLRREGALRVERTGTLETERLSLAAIAAALGEPVAPGEEPQEVRIFVHALDGERRALVIGKEVEHLLPVVRTLRGEAPPLAAAPRPAFELRPEAGSLAYVEFLDVPVALRELARDKPGGALAGSAKHLVFDLSGQEGQVALRVEIDTDSKGAARRAAAVAHGLRLLLSLAMEDDAPDVVSDALRAAKVHTRGSRLTVRLTSPLEGLPATAQGRKR